MATWARAMLEQMAGGFAAAGARVFLFFLGEDDDRFRAVFERLRGERAPFFLFDLNANFNVPLPGDIPGVRRFSWLIDHPVEHLHKLPADAGPLVCGYVDATGVRDHATLRPDIPAVFLPHAGAEPDAVLRPMRDRPIDILWVGHLSTLATDDGFAAALADLPAPWPGIVAEAAQGVLEGGHTPWSALLAAGLAHSTDPRAALGVDAALAPAFATVENRVVAIQRLRILRWLDGFPVHLVGHVPPEIANGPDGAVLAGFTQHGPQDAATIETLMRDGRVTVNSSFLLPAGAHERIWQAAAAGTAILSNRSAFLEAVFGDGAGLVLMPPGRGAFRDRVARMLDGSSDLDAMAERARAILAGGHTYRHRAAAVLDMLCEGV